MEVRTKMLFFDIGANRGDATLAALNLGYKVVALEPAPKIFKELVCNFIYNPNVIPLKFAVSNSDNGSVEFYEAVEDGLSTLNKDWLTSESMPYAGKPFRSVKVNTVTLDFLVEIYGLPDLVKIDVEGAEDLVFAGMTCKPKKLCFEWTTETLDEHIDQLGRLKYINGYQEFALQYIEHHLQEPTEYRPLSEYKNLKSWIQETSAAWESGGWKTSGLRPTADVGMIWVR